MRSVQYSCLFALLLMGCEPSEQQRSQWAEEKRIECLDKVCDGDKPPPAQSGKTAIKLNGQWYLAPSEYVAGFSGLVFYWPSKTPLIGVPGQAHPASQEDFYNVAIEIFLRSKNIPPEPHGYRLVEIAEAKGWIADRKMLRPELEAITMKHVVGPNGQYIDHVTYYVATKLKGTDGSPPVAGCNHADPRNGGGTGFMWRSDIWAGVRMNQKHCADWPEIFQEVTRVLQLLKKA